MASTPRAPSPSRRTGRACLSSWMALARSVTWLSLLTLLSFAWAWRVWWLLRAMWRPAGRQSVFLQDFLNIKYTLLSFVMYDLFISSLQVWTSRLPSIGTLVLLWWPIPRVLGASGSAGGGVKGQGDAGDMGSASGLPCPRDEPERVWKTQESGSKFPLK